MRQLFVKLGHVQSVIVITIFSCLASVLTARLIAYCYSWFGIQISSNIIISTLVPVILAPPISWYIIGLLLKIDQLEVEMRKAATFDPLTGLFSRRAFFERAEYTLNLAAREGRGNLAADYGTKTVENGVAGAAHAGTDVSHRRRRWQSLCLSSYQRTGRET